MNVLHFDGHVKRKKPSTIDPFDPDGKLKLVNSLWQPRRGCEGGDDGDQCGCGTGLVAEYRLGTSFSGAPQTVRIDADLNMPFGSGYARGPSGPNFPNNPIRNASGNYDD